MAKTVSGPPRQSAGPAARARGGARLGRLRRPRGKAVLFAAAGATIVAVLAWALLGSRLLVVRSVQVVGAGRLVSAAQVLAVAHVPHGVPLIRVDTGAIAHRVEQIRQVQYVVVSKDWPSTVVITVRQRTPVFAVRVAGGYALVDRFGVSVRDVTGQPPGLPVLSLGGAGTSLRGNPAVRAAAIVLTELPPRIAHRVRAVSAAGAADVSVTLAKGVVVIWGDTGRAREKAKELTVLMQRHARSYDVSGSGTAVTSG
jgi:cell division protein FtsQ